MGHFSTGIHKINIHPCNNNDDDDDDDDVNL